MGERIDRVAREYVAPLLKQHGFRKRRHVWNRARAALVDAVEIQAFSYNTKEDESFRVSIGIVAPDICQLVWNNNDTGFAREVDALVRQDLSDFWDDSFSESIRHSFMDLATDDISTVGEEIVKALEKKVLPRFETITDYKSLAEDFDRSAKMPFKGYGYTQILYAVLKWKIGKADEATEILESVTNLPWKKRAQEILSLI